VKNGIKRGLTQLSDFSGAARLKNRSTAEFSHTVRKSYFYSFGKEGAALTGWVSGDWWQVSPGVRRSANFKSGLEIA